MSCFLLYTPVAWLALRALCLVVVTMVTLLTTVSLLCYMVTLLIHPIASYHGIQHVPLLLSPCACSVLCPAVVLLCLVPLHAVHAVLLLLRTPLPSLRCNVIPSCSSVAVLGGTCSTVVCHYSSSVFLVLAVLPLHVLCIAVLVFPTVTSSVLAGLSP